MGIKGSSAPRNRISPARRRLPLAFFRGRSLIQRDPGSLALAARASIPRRPTKTDALIKPCPVLGCIMRWNVATEFSSFFPRRAGGLERLDVFLRARVAGRALHAFPFSGSGVLLVSGSWRPAEDGSWTRLSEWMPSWYRGGSHVDGWKRLVALLRAFSCFEKFYESGCSIVRVFKKSRDLLWF